MRYAIYARRSTSEKDERQIQSIDDQLRLTRQHAARLGLDVAYEIPESVSAKEPFKRSNHLSGAGGNTPRDSRQHRLGQRRPARAGFARLLHLIESGQIGGIIAWHPDRLSRNEIDAASLTHLIRTGRLRDLQFCNYTFNNSPEGVMMLQMALSQSQYYSSKLGVDVTRGMQSKVEKGWAPRKAPPGYRNDMHKEKGRKTISADPQRFQTIRKVWDLALTGSYSTTQILEILNHQWRYRSRPTKTRESGPMALNTLYSLLSNVFYTGYFLHNGELHRGNHPAMITMREFEQVQKLHHRTLSPEPTLAKPHKREFAFTGLIRCAGCHGQVTAQQVTKKSGRSYAYYHCRQRGGVCGWKNLAEKQIENKIAAWLESVTVYPEFIEWAWQAYGEWAGKNRAEQSEKQERSRTRVKDVEKQLENLLTMKLRDLITDEEYRAKKAELGSEKTTLSGQEEGIEETVERVRVAMENVTDFMKAASELFRTGDPGFKRHITRNIGSNFSIEGGNLLWEPHPLLAETEKHYQGLKAEFEAIKLDGNRLKSTKKGSFEPVISVWGRLWEQNQTLIAQERITFPKVAGNTQKGNTDSLMQ